MNNYHDYTFNYFRIEYNNRYVIPSTQITNFEVFAFIYLF